MVQSLCYDSTGAIAQANEQSSHQRTKHTLHCYHLAREVVNRDGIDLWKIDGKKNLTDPFTKAFKIKEFDELKWDIVPIGFSPSGSC